MNYDKTKHSTKKLGVVGTVPVLPVMPLGAQTIGAFQVHYQIDADGHYVNGPLPAVPPSRHTEVRAALKAGLTEPSYSGTGREYIHLDVDPDPADPKRFTLRVGQTVIGHGVIDPTAEIVSTDEPLGHDGPGADPEDDDDDPADDTPSVN